MRNSLPYIVAFLFFLIGNYGNFYAQPIVDLGADTSLCGGSIVLNAGNAGSTYLWSTGATTQSITVSASDTFWVDVTNGGTTRDSIAVWVLDVPTAPIVSDTTVCEASVLELSATYAAELLVWFSDNAGLQPIGRSNLIIESDTTLYARAFNLGPGGTTGFPNNQFFSGGGFVTLNSGNRFDAYQAMIIDSLAVYVSSPPVAIEIELWNSNNEVLELKEVVVDATGKQFIDLDIFVPTGNDYKLMCVGVTGGGIYRNGAGSFASEYPQTIPNIMAITGYTANGATNITNYSSNFYDWRISLPSCGSSSSQLNITANPIPTVNLPADVVFCDTNSFLIDAGAMPGVSYLWNTAATTASITAMASGIYSVEGSFSPDCPVTDSIRVDFLNTPQDPVLTDTSICENEIYTLNSGSSADLLVWFQDSAATQPLGESNVQINSDTTFYVRAFSAASAGRIGYPDNGITTNGGFISFATGSAFNAYQPIVIDAVAVYVNPQPTTLVIELWDASNTVLDTRTFEVTTSGKSLIPLGLFIPTGNDYKLMCKQVIGGGIYRNGPATFTNRDTLPGVMEVTRYTSNGSNAISSTSSVFYDWRITLPLCESAVVPLNLTPITVPAISLINDTAFCDLSSFTINSNGAPNAIYDWNTGDTTASISVSATGTYLVESFFSPECRVTDSVRVEFVETPPAPLVVIDTILCGIQPYTIPVVSGNEKLVWYKDIAGQQPITVGDFTAEIFSDTTFYVQAANSVTKGRVGLPSNQVFAGGGYITFQYGTTFDAIQDIFIDSVAIYVNNFAIQHRIELWNANDSVVDSRTFSIPSVAKAFLPVDFFVPQGNDYKLMYIPDGGGLYRNGSGSFDYPYEIPGFIRLNSSTSSGSNVITSYSPSFYDWRISQPLCTSPIIANSIKVAIPFALPDSIYSCSPVALDTEMPFSHSWSTGGTSSAITVDTTGIYTVEVSNGLGCVVSDTSFVEIPIDAGLPNDGILCGTVLETLYDDNSIFQWSTGDSSSTINVSVPGTYSVIVNEPRGCSLMDTVVITGFDSFPVVNLGPDFSACINATLNAGNPGLSYIWNTGDTIQSISVSSTGIYTVTVTNDNQCAESDTISVLINPLPTALFSFSQITNFQVSFNNLSFPFSTYQWNFGDGSNSSQISPTHVYQDTGTFVVTLIASNGCGNDTLMEEVRIESNVSLRDDLLGEHLDLYPNPIQDQLQVEIHDLPGLSQVVIRDLVGKEVWAKELIIGQEIFRDTWNIGSLSEGIYLFSLIHEGQITNRKIIVSKTQ